MGITQQIGASSLIKPGVCTSSTRPVSPYEGQAIYETDTDKVLVWNGTAWYPNWNLPWGYIANQTVTSAQTGITTEVDLTGLTVTFTAQANRFYMMVAVVNAYGAGGQWANVSLNINGANVRFFRSSFGTANVFNTETYQHQFTVATGSCTAKLRMSRENAGAASVNHYSDANYISSISIIDLGPA
jgi:hypothetical protein